jgi:hypothetical protein
MTKEQNLCWHQVNKNSHFYFNILMKCFFLINKLNTSKRNNEHRSNQCKSYDSKIDELETRKTNKHGGWKITRALV